MKAKVLVVDDSIYMRTVLKDALVDAGLEVIAEAENGEKAIDLALEHKPDLITLDNILPDMLGMDVLKVLKDEDCGSKVIMISAVGQQSVIDEGMSIGADEYIVKPFTTEQLIESVNKVLGVSQ